MMQVRFDSHHGCGAGDFRPWALAVMRTAAVMGYFALATARADAPAEPQANPPADPQIEAPTAPASDSQPSQPISPAETLLFMTHHLEQVQVPSRLHYSFRKTGTMEAGFSDTVDIDISAEPDGARKGVARFLSGTRQINYPEMEHAEGNPVLLYYLEREIREMARMTGGKANYFRKRIRVALADTAEVKPVTIRLGGRTLAAKQITISPYLDDPNKSRFERLVAKQYIFTLSDQVPGYIYQVRGFVPAPDESSKARVVIDETLTFVSAGSPK
jgi:hypothetical protein